MGPLGPLASGEQPGLAAPDASRVTQVWSRARHAWWLVAYPVVLTLAPRPTRSLIGRAGSSARALSTRCSHGDPSLRTGLSGDASISLLRSEPASFLSSARKGSQLPSGVSASMWGSQLLGRPLALLKPSSEAQAFSLIDSPDSRGVGGSSAFLHSQVVLCVHLNLVEFTLGATLWLPLAG